MANYTFDEFVNAVEIQHANLPTYLTELGATSADVDKRGKWLDNMHGVQNYCETIDVAKKTAFANKASIMGGKAGDPCSPFAPISTGTWADESQGVGYYETFLEDNRRWMASPGCTPEIIVACALKKVTEAPDAPSVKPTIECDAAQSGNMFTIIVKNRGESSLYDVLGCPVGSSQFSILKTTDTRSTDVTVPPKDPPGPQQYQVRVQLKKGGENYGQLSDIVLVTVVP